MDSDSELIAALRATGRRVTMPRLAVHRHLRESPRHVTAEQVYAELADQIPSLSAATPNHVICRACGRMEDLDAEVDTAGAEKAARAAGFAPAFAQLTVSGLC